MHIIGLQGDGNEAAGYLPSQVANTALERANMPDRQFTDESMSWLEKTLRKCGNPAPPNVIIKNTSNYNGKRYKLWKSRETGAVVWVWPERGFIHMERDSDGAYKKWTCRDALRFAYAHGQQAEVSKWPDEKQHSRNVYLLLTDLVKEARAQGDPTVMTEEERRSLKESVACATVPGLGKITFVGSKVASIAKEGVSNNADE